MSLRLRTAGIAAGLLAAVALFAPAVAGASSASVSEPSLFFFADAGETNNVAIGFNGTDYTVTDTGSTITPGAGCLAVTANEVTCAGATVSRADLRLGDLNDIGQITSSVVDLGTQFGPGGSISGDQGDDTVIGGPNIPNELYGHDSSSDAIGDDTVVGGELSDLLDGGDGHDTVQGGGDRDVLQGGLGNDLIDGGAGDDLIREGEAPNGSDTLVGGTGLNSIRYDDRRVDISVSVNGVADDGAATEGDNVNGQFYDIETGAGNDTVSDAGGNTFLGTGAGNDTISAGGGNDSLYGADGNDQLSGESGQDTLGGGRGDDNVNGGPGDDAMTDGDDEVASGADSYRGGTGIDRLTYFTPEPVSVDLDGVADDGPSGEGDNAGADLEDLLGGTADDILTGNNSANEIDGGGGNDRIKGLGGPDTLLGGSGGDRLDGGGGVDQLDGAGGSDNLRSRDSSPDEVACGSSSDILLADALDDFTVTCEKNSTGARLKTTTARLKKNKAVLRVVCPLAEGIDCKVKVTAKKGKKVLARGSGKVKSGKTGKVKVKLTKAGKQTRSQKLTLKTKTVLTDATGARVATKGPKLVLRR